MNLPHNSRALGNLNRKVTFSWTREVLSSLAWLAICDDTGHPQPDVLPVIILPGGGDLSGRPQELDGSSFCYSDGFLQRTWELEMIYALETYSGLMDRKWFWCHHKFFNIWKKSLIEIFYSTWSFYCIYFDIIFNGYIFWCKKLFVICIFIYKKSNPGKPVTRAIIWRSEDKWLCFTISWDIHPSPLFCDMYYLL